MAVVASLKGLDELVAKLKAKASKARKDAAAVVSVGYTAGYALFVHEDLTAYHEVGQAKFLEQPARVLKETLAAIVAKALAGKRTTAQALLMAGLRLQRESQKLVPVDTGNLKNSAFTRLE